MSQSTHDLSSPEVWRRSLGRSRARRVFEQIVRKRRRRRRGSAVSLSALAILATTGALGAGFASGQSGSRLTLAKGSSGSDVAAVQEALGVSADGVYGGRTRAAVEEYQRRNGLLVDGIAGPQTRSALGLGRASQATSADDGPAAAQSSGSAPSATLERIAQCESGGNPDTVSPSGQYRGKYQFLRSTWEALGGSGDPAKAPEGEQDRIAAKLLERNGTAPWGACGG